MAEVQPAASGTPDGTMDVSPAPNYLLAVVAALAGGLIAAFLYAAIAYSIEREFLILMVAVGGIVGFAISFVTKRENVVTGIIAVIGAAIAIAAAIILFVSMIVAGSIGGGLTGLGDIDFGIAIQVYFEDPLGYVWAAAGLIAAYYFGSNMRSSTQAKAAEKAAAEQAGKDDAKS